MVVEFDAAFGTFSEVSTSPTRVLLFDFEKTRFSKYMPTLCDDRLLVVILTVLLKANRA